jgi:hypothetical protein
MMTILDDCGQVFAENWLFLKKSMSELFCGFYQQYFELKASNFFPIFCQKLFAKLYDIGPCFRVHVSHEIGF